MKRLKKICALTLALLISIFFSGCTQASLSKDAFYWFSDPSSNFKTPYTETCVYNVTVSANTFSSSTEVKNPYGVTLNITSGTYTTTLETREGEGGNRYYLYTTVLDVSGNYSFPTDPITEYPFNDHCTTTTTFTENLQPIKSTRTSPCNSLLVMGDDGYGMMTYKFDYTIDYTDSTANVLLNEYDENDETIPVRFSFKKYSNGAFVDNNTLFLIPRLYNLASGFSRTFKTIDVLSRTNQDMTYYCPGNELDIKNFPVYSLNGVTGTEQVSAARLMISMQDTYAGPAFEAYYAVDKSVHRHRLTRAYTKLNENLGYLCYSLASVTIVE